MINQNKNKTKTKKKIGTTHLIIECDVIEHKDSYEILLPDFTNTSDIPAEIINASDIQDVIKSVGEIEPIKQK